MTILALEPETSGADAAPVTLTRETNSPTCEALDIERAPTHLVVVNANAAFARIENHRKLFRADWLPFLDGVYFLSRTAWETAGSRTTLDGKPDWTYHPVQIAFREAIRGLPWEHYFEKRRPLLFVLRQIGAERERFLEWYDRLDEDVRDRVGHPETLWRRFEKEIRPDDVADRPNDKNEQAARTDADRIAVVITSNENWHDFGVELRESLDKGSSTLEPNLREELDRLLDAEGVR